MIRIVPKPWPNREDGRVLVMKDNKVLFSKHYRNMNHLLDIKKEIKNVTK